MNRSNSEGDKTDSDEEIVNIDSISDENENGESPSKSSSIGFSISPTSSSSSSPFKNRLKSPKFTLSPSASQEITDLSINSDLANEKIRSDESPAVLNFSKSLEFMTKEDLDQQIKETHLTMEELKKFSRWIACFCVVAFDIEIGQSIEYIYPPVEFNESEQSNIRCSAFPDSNSGFLGDSVFTFRTKKERVFTKKDSSKRIKKSTFIYGYVFFRQKKDESLKRGFLQKSVVILSFHPFDALFSEMVRYIGNQYFELGNTLFEAACRNLVEWPEPIPGLKYDLPFLGRILEVEIPSSNNLFNSTPRTKTPDDSKVIISEGKSFQSLKGIVSDLWTCWELMLIAEPIVIFAQSPSMCSEAVISLVNLIKPIPFGGDFRPYFTLQDTEYKEISTKTKQPKNLVIGVTNPYFLKSLDHWPHFLHIGMPDKQGQTVKGGIFDVPKGLKSKHVPICSKEKHILKTLEEEMDDYKFEERVTRYFLAQTQNFLIPLERYFQSLIPLPKSISPWKNPRLKTFSVEEFFDTLKELGPQLSISSKRKSDWMFLYSQFMKSPNFKNWYRMRSNQAKKRLRKAYLTALCDADVKSWMLGKHDIELIDFMIKLKEELREGASESILTDSQMEKLNEHVQTILDGLPEDLRNSLNMSLKEQVDN